MREGWLMQEGSRRSGFLSDLRAAGKIALWDEWPVNTDCVVSMETVAGSQETLVKS